MKRQKWGCLLLLSFLLFSRAAMARIYILIDEASDQKFPIAVPEVTKPNGDTNDLSVKLTELLRNDLDIAGYFRLITEAAYLQDTQPDPNLINFNAWSALEAQALVHSVLVSSGGSLVVEFRLFDTHTRELLVGKQYTVKRDQYYIAVHKFVDEILQAMTGIRGPFNSMVTAACGRAQRRQIAVLNIDGTGFHYLTRNGSNNLSPTFSPDNAEVAFTSFKRDNPDLYAVGVNGKKERPLISADYLVATPAYSPDGTSLVVTMSKTGDSELYRINRQGKVVSQLTRSLNIDISPAFSPDGSEVVFASERAGGLHLFAESAHGGGARRLTYTGYQNDQPDWSPDGTKIVFAARDSGTFDIFVMNADGSMIQRITKLEGSNESPTWSPDSRYIVFSSIRYGSQSLYVTMWDGTNQTAIPGTEGCINSDWGLWLDEVTGR